MTKEILAQGLREARELNLNLIVLKTSPTLTARKINSINTLDELMKYFYQLDSNSKRIMM